MKSVVGAANDAQSLVSKKAPGLYASYRQQQETNCLMKSTKKSAKLICSEKAAFLQYVFI